MRAVGIVLLWMFCVAPLAAEEITVWLGTANSPESQGIYRAKFNTEKGSLTKPELAGEIKSPGFLALHPNGKYLYCVCQLPDRQGGGVAAFEIGKNQSLRLLNTQPIGDGGAAHLAVDASGKCLFTAQYGAGSVAAFPLEEDGKIAPRSNLQKHAGSGPNERRQSKPHAHWVGMGPENKFLFVPDLGMDQVVIYKVDLEQGKLTPHGHGQCPPGSGPRHMKFGPHGKRAYVLNELALTVTVFDYEDGKMTPIQTIEALPEELQEVRCSASEIRFHPNGKFVYTGNRGHDSISVFAVDAKTGKLSFVEREAIRGAWPRNFNVDPTGQWLLAAGGRSNTVSLFQIDQQTGGLVFTGKVVNCPAPICVEFSGK